MALLCESGDGVQGAESYVSTAFIDTYWLNRTHIALAATWAAGTTGHKEGAAREATAYADAMFGPYYRGQDRGYAQGLLFPRSNAFDDAGYPLPGLPPELQAAVAELAARALSATLAADLDRGGMIKSEQVDTIRVEYFEGAMAQKTYGLIMQALSPILNGSQPGAPNAHWSWA
ncbi:MAG: DnaT-like ssDNA-binding protein [Devosia sp.]